MGAGASVTSEFLPDAIGIKSSKQLDHDVSTNREISKSGVEDNSHACQGNQFCKLGIKVSYFKKLIPILKEKLSRAKHLSADEICRQYIIPLTKSYKLSYCDYMLSKEPSCVGNARVFISYPWKSKFIDVLETIVSHFEKEKQGDIFVWMDIFSLNQHEIPVRPLEWYTTTFKTAIGSIGKTVMIFSPWNDSTVLTRGWCLWEMLCSVDNNIPIEIAMNESGTKEFIKSVTENPSTIDQLLAIINVENCECLMPHDRRNIRELLDELGYAKVNAKVFDIIRDTLLIKYEKEVTKDFKKGFYNSEVWDTNTNLAMIYTHFGMYEQAEQLYSTIVQQKKARLGEDDVDTLESMNQLAVLYDNHGKYDEAEAIYLECLERINASESFDHRDAWRFMNNLAVMYIHRGQLEKAEPLQVQCYESRCEILGPDHVETLNSLNNLATLYHNQGKYEQAEPLYARCLQKRKEILGPVHSDTLTLMSNLALLYDNQGAHDKAEPLYLECIERRKATYGLEHPGTLKALSNLSSLQIRSCKLTNASTSVDQEDVAAS